MTVLCLTDGYVKLGSSTVVSQWCTKVETSLEVAELDATTFGNEWGVVAAGLKKGSLSLDFLDDFTDSALDSLLWPLLGTLVAFEIRPTSSAVGTSNPKYTGTVLISKLPAISGQVGELAKKSVQWPSSGSVLRATS